MSAFLTFLFKDPLRKLIALSLTIVLYAVLNEGKQREEIIDGIPMQIKCDDDVFLPEINRSCSVRLTVRGSESTIKKLTKQDIQGTIMLSRNTPGFASGRVTLRFNPKDFAVPRGVEVIRVEHPQELTIPVQRKISRMLPIHPETFGSVQSGWVCNEVTAEPASVIVSGPERLVNTLREVVTEPLNIDGETVSFSKKGLILKNPQPEELSFDLSSAEVSVKIVRIPDVPRKFTDIPVRCMVPPGNSVQLQPDKKIVTVTVSGRQSAINKISGKDITVFADLSDPKYQLPGEHLLQLQAVLNNPQDNLRISAIEPKEIKIKSVVAVEKK
ncbi:MAG: hypothetical protein IKC82_02325 [Lentisphaeria bacterium]|nr:hypothetical protein [Lentisphaeria bacterium]